ncbi:PREDICTED: uncharacterized protein LOC105313268 [Amphimedon queenslandica]|uniref:MADF domain-containing protein n=1 Tax=Amphimedon queenslandica TaxID=400682 RepID=A0A1X7UK93_AMPQE|nr:PREDICTED: uncharacterized protein LOC105313268 [Amphimedon queenslandica]|eukprot:XP_011404863.1 PREDICTED: uncharacterized protein LOC105313268 [Amphimedon queenslandica]
MAEFDESLILCVKDYPCLYNSKSADFRITWKKENAWEEVSKKLVEVASKRWKVLRERYTKEHKKAKKPTGTGTDEVEVWEFYHLMHFLQDFVKHRSTVTNMPTFSTHTDELRFSPGAESTQSNDEATSSSAAALSDNDKDNNKDKAKMRQIESDPIEMEILSQLKKTSDAMISTNDEDFAFAKTVALTLDDLMDDKRLLQK